MEESNLIIKIWRYFNKKSLNSASSIVVLSVPMKEKIIKEYKIDLKKIKVISAWANSEIIKPLKKSKNSFLQKQKLKDKFIILYSGNHGRCHDMLTIIQAANLIKKYEEIVFLFIGNGVKRKSLIEFRNKNFLKNCIFLPFQDYKNLRYTLTSGDLAIVSLNDNAEELVSPSKLYGHMAAGSPIIAICPIKSHLRKVIEENNCGFFVNNGDYKKLSEIIIKSFNDQKKLIPLGENSRNFIVNNASSKIISQKYDNLIKDL